MNTCTTKNGDVNLNIFQQKKQDSMFHQDYWEDRHDDSLSTTRCDDSDDSRDCIFNYFKDDSMGDLSGSFCDYSIFYAASESSVEVSISGLLPIERSRSEIMISRNNLNFCSSSVPKVVEPLSLMRPTKTYPEKKTNSGKKYIFNEKELAERIEHLCRPTKSRHSYLSEGLTRIKNAKRELGISEAPGSLTREEQINKDSGTSSNYNPNQILQQTRAKNVKREYMTSGDLGSLTRQEHTSKEAVSNSNIQLDQIVQHVSRPTKSHLSYLNDSPTNHMRRSTERRQSTNDHHLSRRSHSFTSRQKKRISPPTSDQKISEIVEQLCRPTKSHLSYKSEVSKMKYKSKKSSSPNFRKTMKSNNNQLSQEESQPFQKSVIYKMSSQYPRKSVYERLYVDRRGSKLLQSEINSFNNGTNTELSFPRMCQRPSSKTRSESNNCAHLRLYDCSKKYRLEGKKLRQEIETKKRIKSETKASNQKISASRACRLYYVRTESLKLKFR